MAIENLTQYEYSKLSKKFNFTDGYMHRKLTKAEQSIINDLSKIFKEAEREQCQQLERDFIKSYFKLARQSVQFDSVQYLFCTSASISLEIVANYLRLHNKSVTLVEPCIDTLVNILRRHKVKLRPLSDQLLDKDSFLENIERLNSDAICLVSPNNPTGLEISRENFIKLTNYCKTKKKILILDASCRIFSDPDSIFDHYGLLARSKANFLVVENTGKVFPTKNLKLSILAVSNNLYQSIYDIHSDFILFTPPFTIKLLTKFVDLYIKEDLFTVWATIQKNRQSLYEVIDGSFLKPRETQTSCTAWLELEGITATKLKSWLENAGIYVIPGTNLYWSDPKKGERFIRVALNREPEIFSKAGVILKKVLRRYR